MLRAVTTIACALSFGWPLAAAQGVLEGMLYAPETSGYVVIACYPHAEDGCDEAMSGFATVTGSGGSARFRIEGLRGEVYALIAWRDADGNGEAEEDELYLWLDGGGEPVLVAPGATGLEVVVPGAAPATALPADLVGIWQDTLASSGDYRNAYTGQTFSATSGMTTVLKLRPDGSYRFAQFTAGVSNDCPNVSYLETMAGTASLADGRLVLTPEWRQLAANDCRGSRSQPLAPDLVAYDYRLEPEAYRGWRGTKLVLTPAADLSMTLHLLHRDPLSGMVQPPMPPDFVLGQDGTYQEFIGLWTADPGSDTGFFDPQTDSFYLPPFDGTTPSYLRLTVDGYELAAALRNFNYEGVCKKDYLYYERGRTTFGVTEDVGGFGEHFVGYVRFQASDSRLVVNIRECDEDTGATLYRLSPQTSYYRYIYMASQTGPGMGFPASFQLICLSPRSEWQLAVCQDFTDVQSYTRRE